jgi:type I restriction enzyme, S subunit
MINQTPNGWLECEIGEVARIVSGGTPPSKDPTNFTTNGGIPWITPADLSGYQEKYISRGRRNLSEKGFHACSAAKIPSGSVLFSSRAPVGYVAIALNEVTTNQGFKSFVLPSEVDSRFIYFYLRHIKPIAEQMATGTTFKELSGSATARLPLIIAPLNEQKRIADKLDRLLTRVDACREKCDRIPLILKRFRQAVLAAATSGKLTEDWREENFEFETTSELLERLQKERKVNLQYKTNDSRTRNFSAPLLPGSWSYIPIGVVGEVFLGRQRSPKNHHGEYMRPYVRAANITWNGWNFSDVKEMNFDPRDFERFRLQVGDVLVNEGSGSADEVGKPAIWRGEIKNCCFQNTLICVRPYEKMSEYLYIVCLKAALSKAFVEETRGVNIHHIGKERFSSFLISLPPIAEQQEIVRRVETLFAYADRLEAQYQKAREHIDRLTPAILDKAFRGELVPQDPNDEPASALLERIQALRISTEKSQKKQRQKPVSERIPSSK